MRPIMIFVIGVSLGLGFMLSVSHFHASEPLRPSVSTVEAASAPSESLTISSADLLEMAKIYDEQADELQAEAVRLERKALGLSAKVHLDPKGFRRAGLMNIARLRWKAASEHRELASMHRKEAERLASASRSR